MNCPRIGALVVLSLLSLGGPAARADGESEKARAGQEHGGTCPKGTNCRKTPSATQGAQFVGPNCEGAIQVAVAAVDRARGQPNDYEVIQRVAERLVNVSAVRNDDAALPPYYPVAVCPDLECRTDISHYRVHATASCQITSIVRDESGAAEPDREPGN
jgi:hypothetical protein